MKLPFSWQEYSPLPNATFFLTAFFNLTIIGGHANGKKHGLIDYLMIEIP